MSTNADARPHSRRHFLTAAAAGTVAATGTLGAHVALGAVAEPDPVDTLFRQWLGLQDEMAAATGYTDEWIDEKDAAAIAIERRIRAGAPSPMVAGALCLFALRYGVLYLATSPADLDAEKSSDNDALLALVVLPCIADKLHGRIAEVAADFLAHPDRTVRHSRLFSGNVRVEA